MACPPALDWEIYRSSRVTYRSAKNPPTELVLTRYRDGLYVKAGAKEMYRLRNQLVLFRGLEEKDWNYPGPFFMLEMPAFLAAALVAQRFRDACSVPNELTAFDFAARRDGAFIGYDVKATETRAHAAVIDASGVLELGTLAPLPVDMNIAGWDIGERRPGGWSRLPRPPSVSTVADVYSLKPEPK